MKFAISLVLCSSCIAALFAGCSRQGGEAPPKEAPAAAEPESRVKRGTNGEVFVTVDAATQKTIGLQTTAISSGQLNPQVKGYGRVLDPSPLVQLVADLAAAQAQSTASEAELKRVKTLAAQDNASQRALQTAEAAAARDSVLATAARARLVSGWGAIATHDDLPGFVQSLISLEDALVQITVPTDDFTNAPTSAWIVTPGQNGKPAKGEFLGVATSVDPQMQGRAFLFLVNSNSSRLLPGTAVTAFLDLPGEPRAGVVVPRDAIVRFNGLTWAYVQKRDDQFQRMALTLEHPLAEGWFVSEGLQTGQKVVTVGAQELLSEELKSSAD